MDLHVLMLNSFSVYWKDNGRHVPSALSVFIQMSVVIVGLVKRDDIQLKGWDELVVESNL